MKVMWGLIAIAAIALVGISWSDTFRSTRYDGGGDVTVSPGSDVEGDLIVAGSNVNVQTDIKGDLAVAGSNVTVAGPIQGYVMAAGSTVNINNAVGNDLWAAGSNVYVNALVADNARLAGSSVILQPQARAGALALTFFASLPWVGWLVQLLTLMIGFGALILERKESWRQAPAESPA